MYIYIYISCILYVVYSMMNFVVNKDIYILLLC